ncbi:YchJ family protein [Pseudoalteromonas ostreae]|uniref:YchJ family protein n=1 Tax=Pseudoalteromonas ostreae TaxID=2774154 RepID=UPI001B393EDB|nr:YchJ family metal-binding protein [Pseudoalteromonas ostreae]
MTSLTDSLCLCGSEQSYSDCCEKLHLGNRQATSPEQLMRSRFVAYALKNAKYIYQTYAQEKQAENPIKEIADFANSCRFIKLTVFSADQQEHTGCVEFCVSYFYQNLFCQLHEKSSFIKEDGQWRYLDGEIFPIADIKIKRNDECPCGSGKKYKKCHNV